ncbi:acetate--CoA ligase family protein [Aeromicrobium sp. 50.2.37]|uniref:acetate--CoA ligase family protein n=1 Tax=Aeromicrobium sp. 50.2.37 TaxID=2969305 RepID=UPI0021502756|nr:acetate--CoA ligase [Aeromicrobium sp. 50.2.37]MCR4513058.1 acetate--CoA ligase family protein [Aeromicrobium sp. 50.2.37]
MTVLSTTTLGAALLHPESVAIIGASDDITKTGARPLAFLRKAGYAGRVYPVNPRRDTVLGEKAWPSISALPETPDHVFVAADTRFVVDAVRECGERGVPVVTVLAGGFAEAGPEGAERQRELLEVARRYGVRIVGPNSIGVVNPGAGMLLTANAAFAEDDIPVGRTVVASQSGSVIGALMTRAKAVGIGFAGLVSTGSEIDLTLGEICAATVDDPEVDSYCLFLESLDNAAPLAEFARLAHERGKPVTVYKLGRSDAAAELSVSHTGALAGEDSEASAFFEACGFVRVENFESLVECGAVQRRLADVPRRADGTPPRVGVITSTGGGAAIAVDELEMRGLTVTKPSSAVFQAINDAGVAVVESLIVDLTLAGTRHDKVTSVLGILEASQELDLLVFVIGSSARLNPELAASAIEDFAGRDLPVVAWALPDALTTLARLHWAGVPAFRTIESCAESVAATLRASAPRLDALAVPPVEAVGSTPLGVTALDEHASADVLAAVGARFPVSHVVGPDDSVPADLPYPVVVKVLSDEIAHKSDVGGVEIGLKDADGVQAARERILASVAEHRPEVGADTVLVQEMVTDPVQEVLVGYRVSETVGPLVVLASGGVNVELYGDSAVRLAPVDRAVARTMVEEVRATALSRGYRSAPLGDLDALADLVVSVSRLAHHRPDVVEAEINPVAVLRAGQGVVALDALVTVRTPTPVTKES